MTLTAIDFFCGAGGSSTGLVAAGLDVRGAANHWALAIETHNTNHPATEHYLDDLQQSHPSRYPYADVAWFSPECTNHSLAKGRKRKGIGQLDLWGETGVDPAEERSRATMREVVEFSEFHRYQVVIVENVVDIRHWQHFDDWLRSMINLGYDYKVLYLNAQFFGVPQSRDRFYAVFWRRGNRAPNLDYRPAALCPQHGVINAVQAYKRSDFPWGRYGARRQYVYRCPTCGTEVKPPHVPAASVIDWSLPSPRIGDRERPLKPRTIERIKAGLRKFGRPHVVDLGHMHAAHPGKVTAVDGVLPTQSTQQTAALVEPFLTAQHDGRDPLRAVTDPLWCVTGMNNEQQLVVPPFLVPLKNSAPDGYNQPNIGIDEPLTTIVATSSQHALVQPFFVHPGGVWEREPSAVSDLMPTIMTRETTALVMSYYGGNTVYAPTGEPLPTMRTVQHEALLTDLDALVEDCGFRMLEPHELKLGMSFPDSYIILGNKRDQVKQIGNAVCAQVARWIGQQVKESLS